MKASALIGQQFHGPEPPIMYGRCKQISLRGANASIVEPLYVATPPEARPRY